MTTDAPLTNAGCSLDDILITSQLKARPCRPQDDAAENSALLALAEEIANRPERVLRRTAELALDLCRAESAGISFLDADNPGRLCWQASAGKLAGHAGVASRTEDTPSGTVIAR